MPVGTEALQPGVDVRVGGDVEDQGQDGGHDLPQHRGGGGAGHAHVGEGSQAEDEHRVHDDVDQGPHALGDHGIEGPAGGLEQPLEGDLHKDAHGQAAADAQIGRPVPGDLRRGVLQQEKGLGKDQGGHGEDQGAEQAQQDPVLRRPVHRVLILGPQAAGEQGVDAHAGTHGHGDHQVLKGEGHADCGKGVLAELGHEVAVHHVVKRLDQHGDHHGQGHGQDQPLDGHGPHFVFGGLLGHGFASCAKQSRSGVAAAAKLSVRVISADIFYRKSFG